MPEIGKFPLDDDELEQVSGGATQNTVCNCTMCQPVDKTKAKSCENCLLQFDCPLQ